MAPVHSHYPGGVEAFRTSVRQWLAEARLFGWLEGRRPVGAEWDEFRLAWDAMLHRTGWSCPTWPTKYGGRGLSALESVVLMEELARVGAPVQPASGGEILVGPTILHWGTDAQKDRFLPADRAGRGNLVPGFLPNPAQAPDLACA